MEIKHIELTNWSGQYHSKPDCYVIPESIADLKEIIRNRDKFPSPVVAIGSGHSNSGCNVVPAGTAVIMKKFHFIQEPTFNEVTAGAGIQLYELHSYLAARKLQLPFTPEIGNATLGSVACCCLKDAALGNSSGIASGMIKAIKFIDAQGEDRFIQRGQTGWEYMTSSHGLFGIIYEVTLDVLPMTLVLQNYVHCNVHEKHFVQLYQKALTTNDGIFGLLNASTGQIIFETRNYTNKTDDPKFLEKVLNQLDKNIFKYFNPILGRIEANWYSRLIRKLAMAGFVFLKISYPHGRLTHKCLKPIDYSHQYPYRWDFHFWAYPVSEFPTIVLPAFMRFLEDYKKTHPGFDEKGLMACYRIRIENHAILSPSYQEERMTLDPVRPITKDEKLMKDWDDFCFAYNEFAVQYGGACTFNQTKVLSASQVEKAYGSRWNSFKQARKNADPDGRFLSEYFRQLGITN